jgi:hypothetical protein
MNRIVALALLALLCSLIITGADRTGATIDATRLYEGTVGSTARLHVYEPGEKTGHQGSGVYISPHLLITCSHVIGTARDCQVWQDCSSRDSVVRGRVLYTDSLREVAVVYTDTIGTPLPLRSDLPSPGEAVYAIGSPGEMMGSFSAGIVAGLRRSRGVRGIVQSSLLTEHGASGGPFIDQQGRIVGMVSAGSDDGSFTLGIDVPTIQHVLARMLMAYHVSRDRPSALLREGHAYGSWSSVVLCEDDLCALGGGRALKADLATRASTAAPYATILLGALSGIGLVLRRRRRRLRRAERYRAIRNDLEESRLQGFIPDQLFDLR